MEKLATVPFTLKFIIVLGVVFVVALILTPLTTILARKIGAVDEPNARRINKKPMPTAGGLAIFVAFAVGTLVLLPAIVTRIYVDPTDLSIIHYFGYSLPYVVGAAVVILTGLIDDVCEIKPLTKVVGIFIASTIVWFFTNSRFDNFKIPFGGPLLVFPAWLSFILTALWIILITNAVNIIDGLDGLVSGVSIISLLTMAVVSYFFLPVPNVFLTIMILTLIVAILGFLPYNFNPAIIYLGDTGALFIGFMLSVLSLQGLKNATAVATLTPLIILGVPLTDSVVATIRRTLNKQKFYLPDKMHLHHRLLSMGFTQRGAVFVIWGIALVFSIVSIIFNISSRIGGILLAVSGLIGLELLIELIGIWGENRQPLLALLRYIGNSAYREEIRHRREKKK